MRVLLRVGADELELIRLKAYVFWFLRLVRAALNQPHRGQDEERELKVFGLPVLEHCRAEVGGDQVAGVGDRLAPVLKLLFIEYSLAGYGLPGECAEEEKEEEE